MTWPWFTDVLFEKKVKSKKEINEWSMNTNKQCYIDYQIMLANYINPNSPYSEILMYMQPGTGKTLASVAIAENFIRKGKKVLVITKNENLILDFKNELVSMCSRYSNEEELAAYKAGDPDVKKQLFNKIKSYTFITHDIFKKNKYSKLSDRVIIIDEVHNLISDKGYNILMKTLANSVNYHLVLLSATPAYDKVSDIFKISNILNARDDAFHFKLNDKTLVEKVDSDSGILSGAIERLSSKALNLLKKSLKGKVHFRKTEPKNFPEKIIIEETCLMSEFQESRYMKILDQINTQNFGTLIGSASSIVYPDFGDNTMIGPAGYEKYVQKSTGILKMPGLFEYSTKLAKLIENINSSIGKIFIFSNYITDDGVGLIKQALRANNIRDFIVLTSEVSVSKRNKAIEKFNSPRNDDGSILRIIIASSVVSEGITFKSIRNLHIYEPSWNMSELDQVIGRAVRNNSHQSLPENERYVKIHMYSSVPSDASKSFDLSKYKLARAKDRTIKVLDKMILENEFSCSNTRQDGVDGSRECEYSSCDINCSHDSVVEKIDYSTYILNDRLVKLFEESPVWSVKDLSYELELAEEDVSIIMKNVYYSSTTIETINFEYYITVEDVQLVVKPVITIKDGVLFIKNEDTGKDKRCLNFKKEELYDILLKAGKPKDLQAKKDDLCKEIERL